MLKLSYEDKRNIYYEIKKSLSKKYKIEIDIINYLVSLVDKHKFSIFRITKNKKFNFYEKK